MIKEKILKRVIRLLPDGIFVIDLQGKVIFWNRMLEEMTGVCEEDIVGKGDFEYSIPFYGFRRIMPVDYILNPDMHYPEYLNKSKDCVEIETFLPKLYGGKGAWVRLTAAPIVDEACDLIGAVQIVRDITARKLAEFDLRKIKNVIDKSPIGVVITEFSGKITYSNKAFLEYLKLENVEDENIFNIFPEISLYEIHNHYLKEIKHNGKIFRLRGIKLQQEKITEYAIFLTDITELRKYEEQIIISHKMESIKRLISFYTHNLKNMFTGIKGFAQIALQRENLDMAKSDIEKLLEIVDYILEDINKILHFGRDIIRFPKLIDLRNTIREIIPFIKTILKENIKLIIEIEEEPLMIFADKDDIVKIVLNLVLNSQDAMPNGGELRIELRKKSLPEGFKVFIEQKILEDYACLTITDTGIGMDEETKAKIFEPFFTTKGEKGSGLGLPTVYYIVQMLNGYIFFDSEVGKGTKFDIYIPLNI